MIQGHTVCELCIPRSTLSTYRWSASLWSSTSNILPTRNSRGNSSCAVTKQRAHQYGNLTKHTQLCMSIHIHTQVQTVCHLYFQLCRHGTSKTLTEFVLHNTHNTI